MLYNKDMLMIYKEKTKLLDNIAFNILLHKGIKSPPEFLIEDEMARIDRIIADHYVKSDQLKEYNQFAIDFLTENMYTLIFTNDYKDVKFPEEMSETNVNAMINVMKKRGEKFPEVA